MKLHKSVLLFLLLTSFIVFFAVFLEARAEEIVILKLEDLDKRELDWENFNLGKDIKIHIFAVGATHRSSQSMYAYAWIINKDNHRVVWEMKKSRTSRYERSKRLREYDETIKLPAGNYRAYYYAGHIFGDYDLQVDSWNDFWGFIGDIVDGTKSEFSESSEKDLRELKIILTTKDKNYLPKKETKSKKVDLVKLDKLGDFHYEQIGFECLRLRRIFLQR